MPATPRYYQPSITRLPSLICLLLISLALIALTEIACRRLPVLETNGLSAIAKSVERSQRRKRAAAPNPQDESPTTSSGGTENTLVSSTTSALPYPTTSAYLPLGSTTSTAIPSAYLPLDSTTEAANPSAYLPLSSTTSTAIPSAYLPLGSTTEAAYSSAYLPLDSASEAVPSAYLPLGSTTAAANPSAYLPLDPSTTAQNDDADSGSAAETAYVPVDPSEAIVSGAYPSNYLPVVASQTATITNYLPAAVSFTSLSAEISNYLPISGFLTQTDTSENAILVSNSGSDHRPVVLTTSSAAEATADASAAESNYLPLVLTTRSTQGPTSVDASASGSAFKTKYPTPTSLITSAGSLTAMPALDGVIHGMSYTIHDGVLYINGSTFSTAIPTTVTLNSDEILKVDPTGAISLISQPDDKSGNVSGVTGYERIGIGAREYFIGAFLPTILAVLFSAPWPLLTSALQEMEPFYQLQELQGVPASKSLLLDYKSSINVIATFNAMRRGHFAVWWSGLISLAILLLAPLASEAVFIGFIGQGVCTATSGRSACTTPRLSVYPVAARAIQGILAVVIVLTLALIIAISRRKSGVYANPLSIASIATLFQNQYLIEEIRRLNPFTLDPKLLKAALEGQRYRLGSYKEMDGDHSYGLMVCQSSIFIRDGDGLVQSHDGKKYASVAVTGLDDNPHPRHHAKSKMMSSTVFIHPIAVVIYGILVAGLEVLVLYYNQTGGDTAFERFMDSNSFGVSFLFTAVGVGVKLYWTLLDDGKTIASRQRHLPLTHDAEIRAMEPYRQLLHGSAPASDSILLAPHSNPFTGLFYSLRNGHYFNAYISFVAVLCEPLIVALANIPFKPALAFIAYRICTYISIGILSLMLIGIAWMLCRKRTPGLSTDRPKNLAEVMVALCGSHMLEDFTGMSTFEKKERDGIIKGWGKGYSMGSLVGVDGVEREGIDEDLFVDHQGRERPRKESSYREGSSSREASPALG
ncbi:MAG: hypothetical protein Q9195_004516 [Heterodermia aff. obscurata]